MDIEAVDACSAPDETLLTIHRIEAHRLEEVHDRRSAEEALGFMRNPPAHERRLHWLAYDGGEAVGMARLNLHEESSLPWLYLAVLPAYRRRGVGRALLGVAREAAGSKPIGGHYARPEGEAFARAVGAVDAQRDVRSELDLRTAALSDVVVPVPYRLHSWVGTAPDELVESFASARNAIVDAPHPEGEGMPMWSVARVRDLEAAVARRARQARVSVALAGDEVVAFTELRVASPPAAVANTEDTATVREHRGRGLSKAVKTESLRLLRAERPDIETVTTLNAESNAPIRAINAKLGFAPVVTLTSAVLEPGAYSVGGQPR